MTCSVVIIGATGQLGQSLLRTAPAHYPVTPLSRPEFDITNAAQVNDRLEALAPAVIINACAYTAVDHAESEKERAYQVNEQGVRTLAQVAARIQARLIHVSTDYVFSGASGRHQKPEDSVHPVNVYGASKLAGEKALAAVAGLDWVVVRTAWLYSNFGHNFLNTMLRLMAARDSVSVVYDQVGTPTSALSLARTLWRIIENPQLQGVYHWTDAGAASWYDFAVAIQEEAQALGLLNKAIPIKPIPSSGYPTPAARPACSLLDKEKLRSEIALEHPHWRQALRAVLTDRLK